MIVVDTSAIIAMLQQEPEAEAIAEQLRTAPAATIGAPTKFELLLVASRRPQSIDDVRNTLAAFSIAVAPWTDDLAELAIDAHLRFGKGRHPAALNFGDCMAYALAKSLDAPLLFKGDDFAKTDVRSAIAPGLA